MTGLKKWIMEILSSYGTGGTVCLVIYKQETKKQTQDKEKQRLERSICFQMGGSC